MLRLKSGSTSITSRSGVLTKFPLPDLPISTPHFTGQSYLSLPTLTNAYSDLQLSVEFKPEAPNGILLLTGETSDMTGDYLTLLLRDGHVELR